MSAAAELLDNARNKLDEAIECEASGDQRMAIDTAECAEVLVRQARQELKSDLIEK